MSYTAMLLPLVVVLCLPVLTQSEEEITEEYVVDVLSGEQQAVGPEKPPGIAFSVAFDPSDQEESGGDPTRPRGNTIEEQDLYHKLIPLGRVLESEVLRGFRFAITVQADAPIPGDHQKMSPMRVAEAIKHILTTHFALPSDRLILNTPSDTNGKERRFSLIDHARERKRVPHWRVEIVRVE